MHLLSFARTTESYQGHPSYHEKRTFFWKTSVARIDLGDKLPNYLHKDILNFFGVKKWPYGYRITTITKIIH